MSAASFVFGALRLPPESATLAKAICAEAGITSKQLYCKWEAWALSHGKSSDAPSASDLEELASYIRATAAKAAITPVKAAARLLYAAGPTPTRVNVNDFFSYFEADDVPPPEEAEPTTMDVEMAAEPSAAAEKKNADTGQAGDDLVLAGAAIGQPQAVALAGDGEADSTYLSRDGSGRVEAMLNGGVPDVSTVSRTLVAARPVSSTEPVNRYMNDDVSGKIEAVRGRLRELGERILARVKEMRGDGEELPKLSTESFFVRSPDVVLAVGRVRVELDETDGVTGGRINPSSVVLESEDGNMVKLNLSRVHEKKQPLFLHPGMVVVVEGVNTNGRSMQVHAIYDNAMALPTDSRPAKKEVKLAEDDDEVLPDGGQGIDDEPFASVMFAAGPYTTNTNLNYEPLGDLLAVVARTRPDTVVLTGPFVDAEHEQISAATPVPFEQIFETRVMARLRKAIASMSADSPADSPRPHFVLIPSLSDVHHDFVCPQPAFRRLAGQSPDAGISLLPNPSVLELSSGSGSFVASVGISSLPALQDISGDCLCWNKGDRFSAIASHMLRQCSFYPTFPPSSAVPLDCSLMEGIGLPDLGRTPTVDVLVTPSRLKAFAKNVDGGAVAVNPGLLCRGSSGGTYAELRIPLHDARKQRPLNGNADKLQASIVRL